MNLAKSKISNKYSSEFVSAVTAAYDEYFLAKVKESPNGGFLYNTDTYRFIHWLETGKLDAPTEKQKLALMNKEKS